MYLLQQDINQNQSHNLNDGLLFPVEVFIGGFVLRKDYEDTLAKLYDRINWNKGIKCYPINFGAGCLGLAEVDKILKVYINLVDKGTIPEYDRKKNPSKIELIEKQVAEKSGVSLGKVKITLWSLYYATIMEDSPLRTDTVLKPLTGNKNKHLYQQTNPNSDSVRNDPIWGGGPTGEGGFLGNITDVLKWILIGGVGLVVIGGVAYVYKFYGLSKFFLKAA